MKNGLLGTLAASAALALTAGLASSSYAESNPPGCPKGYFCMYSGENQNGTLLKKASGDWGPGDSSGFVKGVRSIFNNGNDCSGCDHVDFTFYDGLSNHIRCYHYNPGPGTYKYNFSIGVTAKGVRWRGEC